MLSTNEGRTNSPARVAAFLAGLPVRVFEQLEAGDHPEAAEEDLVRAGIPADVVRIPGSVREIGEAGLPGEEAVRDARAGRARDDAAAADGVPLLRLGLMVGARLRREARNSRSEPKAFGRRPLHRPSARCAVC